MNHRDTTELKCDVLVVGGGLAGCWAALRARDFTPRVTLVDKGVVARSGTAIFCHDILAPMPDGELELWLADMMEHTEYLGDQRFAEMLLQEEGDRIRQLADWGVPFERDEKGELFLSLGRGHKHSRVVLVDCRKLMEVMKSKLLASGVQLVERVMVTDLLTSDGLSPTRGRITGAVGINTRTGAFVVFQAKAVFLSTGMAGDKMHTAYTDNVTGDGQAMALRAGAELAGLEFNFGPNFITPYKGRIYLLTVLWPLQTQGAYIVNRLGERFMERYLPERKERRATQGLIGQAMAKEILEGRGPVYFDMRHFTPEHFQQLRRILPIRMAAFDDMGIDPSRELVPCRPLVGYIGSGGCGGIRISIDGETNLPGLFAGGVAAQFPGYAECLSGGKLAFCNVIGYRAGERGGQLAAELPHSRVDPDQVKILREAILVPAKRETGVPPLEIYNRLNRKKARLDCSIVKSEQTIKEMLEEIELTRQEDLFRVRAGDFHELVKASEARNFVDFLQAVYLSSLERKESRLCHYRLDYPFQDDVNWLKWVVVKRQNGGLAVRHEPLPLEEFRLRPKERTRVPSPIKINL